MLVARAPHDVAEALLAHAARRARSAGRLAILARAHAGAPLWQEVAARLSLPRIACDPVKCAEQIATAALLRRATIIAPLPAAGTWDRAVAVELSLLASPPLVLFVAEGEDAADDLKGERFDVAPTLDGDEKKRWWSAIAEEAHAMVASDQLAQLDSWWGAVKRASAARRRRPTRKRPRKRGARCSRRWRWPEGSWPMAQLGALGVTDAWSTGDALASSERRGR